METLVVLPRSSTEWPEIPSSSPKKLRCAVQRGVGGGACRSALKGSVLRPKVTPVCAEWLACTMNHIHVGLITEEQEWWNKKKHSGPNCKGGISTKRRPLERTELAHALHFFSRFASCITYQFSFMRFKSAEWRVKLLLKRHWFWGWTWLTTHVSLLWFFSCWNKNVLNLYQTYPCEHLIEVLKANIR